MDTAQDSKYDYYSKVNGMDRIVTLSNVDDLIAEARMIALIGGTKYPQIELHIDPRIYGPSVHTFVRLIVR
jgi:hypothetical protein